MDFRVLMKQISVLDTCFSYIGINKISYMGYWNYSFQQEYSGPEGSIVCSFSKILNTWAEWLPSSNYNEIPMGMSYWIKKPLICMKSFQSLGNCAETVMQISMLLVIIIIMYIYIYRFMSTKQDAGLVVS